MHMEEAKRSERDANSSGESVSPFTTRTTRSRGDSVRLVSFDIGDFCEYGFELAAARTLGPCLEVLFGH